MEDAKEIWEILKEVGRKLNELSESQKETEKRFKETDKLLKDTKKLVDGLAKRHEETEKSLKELIEQQKETEKRFKETEKRFRETEKRFRETEKRFKETDEYIKKLSLEIKEIGKQVRDTTKAVAQLNGVWQNYTEDTIREGLRYALKELEFKGFKVMSNIKVEKGDENMEIDGLVLGDDYVIVLEVKTTLRVKDVKRFVKKLKDEFLRFFPEYKNYKLYGAIAGMRFQEGVDAYAIKEGLIVLKHKDGRDVKVLNPKNFKPKDFSKG